jgi:hypothetical protein
MRVLQGEYENRARALGRREAILLSPPPFSLSTVRQGRFAGSTDGIRPVFEIGRQTDSEFLSRAVIFEMPDSQRALDLGK